MNSFPSKKRSTIKSTFKVNGSLDDSCSDDQEEDNQAMINAQPPKSSLTKGSSATKQVSQTVACDEMCFYCFDVLYAHLYQKPQPKEPDFSNHAYPLFVTWKIGREQRLRGCIGTFNSIPLHNGLREYSLTSALRDHRFEPITKDEFSRLNVYVSVLLNFEAGSDWKDWVIGLHGIRIEFRLENGTKRTATYLPEVALEQQWDHMQTIDSLLRKGGFHGPITEQTRQNLRLTRYTSEKISASYQDYLQKVSPY